MKRDKLIVLLLVMLVASLIMGCSNISQTITPRDSLKVDKALLGHWVNTQGTPDYYFTDAGLTKVDKDGTKTNMTYVIVKSNDNENTITIRINNPAGTVMDEDMRDIKFSTDKKTMTETVSLLGIKISENNYTYVDNKTKP